MPYVAAPGCSSPVAAIHVPPVVPARAATNWCSAAPIASAATAVRSAPSDRGWSRSTSWSPRTSASRLFTAAASRSTSTRPSSSERPCRMLKVAMRTPALCPTEAGSTALVGGSRTVVQPSDRDETRDLLKRTAVALKQGDVPFALCGGYAAWVRGAPEPDHDADFLVPEAEADWAVKVLADAGLEVQDPPEDWLIKVVSGNSFVDVLWRTCGHPVESELIDRAEDRAVLSVHMPVLAATDIVVTKLMALDEHYCDFARMLPVVRALREQVDWSRVARDVAANDFAAVFLVLLERLGIIDAAAAA